MDFNEDDHEVVFFKYERLPITHDDRECEVWLTQQGFTTGLAFHEVNS